MSRIYRNKIDSRLHVFGVLKERDCLAKAESYNSIVNVNIKEQLNTSVSW